MTCKMRVALTQSLGRLEHLKKLLEKNGFTVVHNPLIETQPLLTKEVRKQAKELLNYQWLLFSSSAAVESWQALGLPFCSTKEILKCPKLGAVGNKTAQKIEGFGGKVEIIGKPQNAAGLTKVFLKSYPNAISVALPKGNKGLDILQKTLEVRGIVTKSLVIYNTLQKTWQVGEVDVVILASPSAVEALPKHIGDKTILVALGKTTYQKLVERGWKGMCAREPTSEAVLQVLTYAKEMANKML